MHCHDGPYEVKRPSTVVISLFGLWTCASVFSGIVLAGCAPAGRLGAEAREDKTTVTIRTNDGHAQTVLMPVPVLNPDTKEPLRASEISPLAQEIVYALLDYQSVRSDRIITPNDHVLWDLHVDPENLVVRYEEKDDKVTAVWFKGDNIAHTLTDREKEGVAIICKDTLVLHKKLQKLELFHKLHAARVEAGEARLQVKTAKK